MSPVIRTVFDVHRRFVEVTGMPPETIGQEKDVYWVTCRNRGTYGMCGFVMIPDSGHPWSGGVNTKDISAASERRLLDVHGGVTLASWPWLGFETSHDGDRWPYEYDEYGRSRRLDKNSPVKTWSPALVEREAAKLARQLAAITAAKLVEGTVRWAARFQHLDIETGQ
jgi:hypothetical protein